VTVNPPPPPPRPRVRSRRLYLALGGAVVAAIAVGTAIYLTSRGTDVVKNPRFDVALLRSLPSRPNLPSLVRRPVPGPGACAFGDHISPPDAGGHGLSVYCQHDSNHRGGVFDIGSKTARDYKAKDDTVTCRSYARGVFCLVVHDHALLQWSGASESKAVRALDELTRLVAAAG
jgi:hypothetical protein